MKDLKSAPSSSLATVCWGVGRIILPIYLVVSSGAWAAESLLPERPAPARDRNEIVVPEYNLRVRIPEPPWFEFTPPASEGTFRLGFRRTDLQLEWIIRVSIPGPSADFSTESWMERVEEELVSDVPTAVKLRESAREIAGISGRQAHYLSSDGDRLVRHALWGAAHRGFNIQQSLQSKLLTEAALAAEIKRRFAQWDLLDRDAPAPTPPVAPLSFSSPKFGFSLKLPSDRWRRSTVTSETMGIEFSAACGDGLAVVLPLLFWGLEPNLEATITALLARFDVVYPSAAVLYPAPIRKDGIEGLVFDHERVVGGAKLYYSMAVLKSSDRAFLLAAWTARSIPTSRAMLESLVQEFKILELPRQTPAEADQWPVLFRDCHAYAFNDIGLFYYRNQQYDRALEWFTRSNALQRQNPTILENVLTAYMDLKRFREAAAFLEANAGSLSAWTDGLRLRQAFLESQQGNAATAIEMYRKVFASRAEDESHFAVYLRLLAGRQQLDEALQEAERFLNKKESLEIRLIQAELLRQNNRAAEAVLLLKKVAPQFSRSPQIGSALMQAHQAAGEFAAAVDVGKDLIAQGNDSALVLYLKGQAELSLKRFPEAKRTFEAALKKAPDESAIRAALDRVSGLLGEGRNYSVKEVIPPIWPPGYPPADALTNSLPPDLEKYGAWFERRLTSISYARTGEHKRTFHFLARVFNQAGISAFSTLQFVFDPLAEEVFVNTLRVRNRSGDLLGEGKPSDYYVSDLASASLATHRQVLYAPVPALEPGAQVEYTVTTRSRAPLAEFPFSAFVLSAHFPSAEESVYVAGEIGAIRWRTPQDVPLSRSESNLWWTLQQPPVYEAEPGQPDVSTFLPVLFLADAQVTWEKAAADYLGSIADRLAPSVPLPRPLQNLSTTDSPESRVAAVVDFVQRTLVYKAIEFGQRSRIPNQPERILELKYGDCKDHALLLVHLLRTAGVPAHLALVRSSGDLQTELPSLDQFDHMIVCWPTPDGDQFLDPTDKSIRPLRAVPMQLIQQSALVLDPAKPRLVRISPGPDNIRLGTLEREIRIVDLAHASVTEHLVLHGNSAAALRAFLRLQDANAGRTAVQQQFLQLLPSADVQELTVSNAETNTGPLQVDVKYEIRNHVHTSGPSLIARLPVTWERAYLTFETQAQRKTAYELRLPIRFSSVTRVHLPPGWAADQAEGSRSTDSITAARHDCRAERSPEDYRLISECSIAPGRLTPAQFASSRQEIEQALRWMGQNLTLKPALP